MTTNSRCKNERHRWSANYVTWHHMIRSKITPSSEIVTYHCHLPTTSRSNERSRANRIDRTALPITSFVWFICDMWGNGHIQPMQLVGVNGILHRDAHLSVNNRDSVLQDMLFLSGFFTNAHSWLIGHVPSGELVHKCS